MMGVGCCRKSPAKIWCFFPIISTAIRGAREKLHTDTVKAAEGLLCCFNSDYSVIGHLVTDLLGSYETGAIVQYTPLLTPY